MILALDFPPVSQAIRWPILFGGDVFGVNKVVLMMWLSVVIVAAIFISGGRKRQLVPTGTQNLAEATVGFIQDGVIMQTIGEDGMGYTPFLLTMFTFVFACNIWEVIPGAQMPVNARIALPMFLAILTWVIFNFVGLKKQGGLKYFLNMAFPPGVPKFLYVLVTPIEIVSTIIVRPLSLSVRLFANMMAGHLLLVSFGVLSAALWSAQAFYVGWVAPFALLVAMTGFEVLVAFLQAFIFTILTAVYIGGAIHPEH